ncbi:GGDEF domain-containing protein [Bermanella marisrubri]|uniref:Response regulator containing a CheY-like receiver domain and a GGDEF domain n=1 Tax=Bermanella marisrubri TaxID=207949 RepID=Q1N074_9GAMM|nr:GGDEF domain-containing protein [Bermanella marisrubri]EAT11643.1 Response regulator containing a CheY-like receiver domain and a GGDEF domain [Oceanobacter sp. RED65] [Bermanella marisrubri]QIZ83316.1 GGDEF domain-containing protein [Bermanella marisrubri]
MFNLGLSRTPALSLLYALLAIANALLTMNHYWSGMYHIVLIHLSAATAYGFAAVFIYLSTNSKISDMINLMALACIAIVTQYQLHYEAELTLYWLFTFPIISYFVLPMPRAFALNSAVLISSVSQLYGQFTLQQLLSLISVYLLIGLCSLCYAYLNTNRQKKLLELAVTDHLSGAFNIRQLRKKLDIEIARSHFTHRTLSLIALTIDDYHQILEIHGRHQSEQLLKQFNHVLMELLRTGDEIFHDGKGSFYLLLPNCPNEGAVVLRERLNHTLKTKQWGEIGELQINTGMATLGANETSENFLERTLKQIKQQQQTALRLLSFKG